MKTEQVKFGTSIEYKDYMGVLKFDKTKMRALMVCVDTNHSFEVKADTSYELQQEVIKVVDCKDLEALATYYSMDPNGGYTVVECCEVYESLQAFFNEVDVTLHTSMIGDGCLQKPYKVIVTGEKFPTEFYYCDEI